MKFGKVENPELIDFSLPKVHQNTLDVLREGSSNDKANIYIGCAKWNKADLKGFYPKGTKDELSYYSNQFNAIELNATFYRQFPAEQFGKWKEKTPASFKFFPKLTQEISHWKRLDGVQNAVNFYLECASRLEEKLGTIFLQLHTNFGPKNFSKLENFIRSWPKSVPLAVEVRHPDWFLEETFNEYSMLLEENNVASILVDTAGRRDMLHMRLTNKEAFIRYVGANHPSDYERLEDWVGVLKSWCDIGIEKIHFFIHQNLEVESPLLAAYFIKRLNKELQLDLKIPNSVATPLQNTLF